MATTGPAAGSVVCGRVLVQTCSAAVRGLEVTENSKLPFNAVTPRARLRTTGYLHRISSSSSTPRGIHSSLRTAGFDTGTTGAAMIANSANFRRAAQLERHFNPRPWDARKTLSTNPTTGGGMTVNASFVVQLVEKVIRIVTSLLPGKAFAEKVEAEVDAAAALVQQGAKIVSDIANEVEDLANAAELGADEVERIAQKVEDVTNTIKKTVDDVADVLEGEKGVTTLVQTVDQLKKVAAAKKAEETDSAAAATTITVVSDE